MAGSGVEGGTRRDQARQVLPARLLAGGRSVEPRTADWRLGQVARPVPRVSTVLLRPGAPGGGAAGAHVLRCDVTIPTPWSRPLATGLATVCSRGGLQWLLLRSLLLRVLARPGEGPKGTQRVPKAAARGSKHEWKPER